MPEKQALDHLKTIFSEAVKRVDPYAMLMQALHRDGDSLTVETETESRSFDLSRFNRLVVVGAGKASAKMGLAIEEVLGDIISEGLIATKAGHGEPLQKIEIIETGHPIPDQNSVKASERIASLAKQGDEKTLFISLISGGGSALLSYPVSYPEKSSDYSLTLSEKQDVNQQLLSCGATIQEINCVRKHLSAIKGGRLAQLFSPSMSLNLILSDVVGDRLDSIASGITAPDTTTYKEAMEILEKYGIQARIPQKALSILKAGAQGELPESPKPEDPCFGSVHNVLVGTNFAAVMAAEKEAKHLGYHTCVISSQIVGEAKEVAKLFLGISRDIKQHEIPVKRPACVLAGGETTVTIRGEGKGGRNQEMALSFLSDAVTQRDLLTDVYFLSAGTDGNDGPTDAAGAFACTEAITTAGREDLNPLHYLRNNDSYHFFERIGYLYAPGPTNTNVCDIQILIVT